MPPIETADLTQKAVLWTVASLDRYGKPKRSSPVELDVRWESGQGLVESPQSDNVAVAAMVVVDQVIAVGSFMWKGSLASLPADPTDILLVADYSEIPDVKGRNFRRVVTLTRQGDSLPATL